MFSIFENHAEDREYHRLRLMESANDPATIAVWNAWEYTKDGRGWNWALVPV